MKPVALVSTVIVLASAVAVAFPTQQPATSTTSPIPFRVQRLDDGQSETAALADVNRDGAVDVVSSDSWYEAPTWTKHPIRTIPFTNSYVDNFSDLPVDVNGDGFVDVVQIAYFARRIAWVQNPGPAGGPWTAHDIEAIGPTEFAFLVDLNNDGRALELLPQFTTAAQAPLTWYELQNGQWTRRVVATQSYGHGIGSGDLNGDGRADILTPQGWLEAPADVRAPGVWTFHATDWLQPRIPIGRPPVPTVAPEPAAPGPAAPPLRVEFGFMHVIDLNEDGRKDVLTSMAHSFGVLWFEQRADGTWAQHLIDNTWSRGHASVLADLNGDGRVDFVTGTRLAGRNAVETEPLAMYWYEYRPGPTVSWTRHAISLGGEAGGGLQIAAGDLDGDGDVDLVSGGKSGVFLYENLRRR